MHKLWKINKYVANTYTEEGFRGTNLVKKINNLVRSWLEEIFQKKVMNWKTPPKTSWIFPFTYSKEVDREGVLGGSWPPTSVWRNFDEIFWLIYCRTFHKILWFFTIFQFTAYLFHNLTDKKTHKTSETQPFDRQSSSSFWHTFKINRIYFKHTFWRCIVFSAVWNYKKKIINMWMRKKIVSNFRIKRRKTLLKMRIFMLSSLKISISNSFRGWILIFWKF